MIIRAIYANSPYEKKGATRQYIKKYLETNYKIEPTNPHINKSIKRLIENEEIIVNPYYSGHYRLSPQNKKKMIKDQ